MKWNKETKEKIQYATAVLMLTAGVTMGFLALAMNEWKEIPDSVLWFAAQCFIYAGSIFGVAMVINYKFDKIYNLINNKENGKNENSKMAA